MDKQIADHKAPCAFWCTLCNRPHRRGDPLFTGHHYKDHQKKKRGDGRPPTPTPKSCEECIVCNVWHRAGHPATNDKMESALESASELKYAIHKIIDAKGLLAAMRIVAFLRWCTDMKFCYWCEESITEFDSHPCPWGDAWRKMKAKEMKASEQ